MKNRSRRLKLMWVSLANGLVLLLLTFYWLSLPYTFGDEAFLIRWTSLVKKELLGIDPKPAPEAALFIDISANKTVIEGEDLFGPSEFNKKVITDRAQLAILMELMAPYADSIPLIFVDVLFEDPTPQDSLLAARFALFGDKILGVSHLREGEELVRPVLPIPYALSTYRTTQGLFLKYPLLMRDTLKTVPLVFLEKLDRARFSRRAGAYWIDGKMSLSAPLVDFKVRNSDFRTGTSFEESNFTVYDLGTILKSYQLLGEEGVSAYFKNRIVLIGDYINDVHDTPFGELAGPLIIYNSFLSLREEGNIVSLRWVLFLVLGYALLSYRVIAEKKVEKPLVLTRVFASKVGRFILNSLDEALILAIITVASYFIFDIHINILILLVVVKIQEYFWKLWKDRQERIAGIVDRETGIVEQ